MAWERGELNREVATLDIDEVVSLLSADEEGADEAEETRLPLDRLDSATVLF